MLANLSPISSAWDAARPKPLTAEVKYLTASEVLIAATFADFAATSANSIASFKERPCLKNSTTTPDISDTATPVSLARFWYAPKSCQASFLFMFVTIAASVIALSSSVTTWMVSLIILFTALIAA